jgi:hypothetical protein
MMKETTSMKISTTRRNVEARFQKICLALFALCFFASSFETVVAFVPSRGRISAPFHSTTESPVVLFGLRNKLKKKFLKGGKDERPSDSSATPTSAINITPATEPAAVSSPSSAAETHEANLRPEPKQPSVTVATEQRPSIEIPQDVVIELPPIEEGRELSKLEEEFRQYIKDVADVPARDVALITNARFRAIVEGARAGATEPAVYRSFEVLFQDYVPIRIVGRMIFSKVMQEIQNARARHDAQVEELATSTGIHPEEVELGRFTFLQIAQHEDDGESFMSFQQLVDSGVASTIVELLGYNSFQELLDDLDKDKTGKLTFAQLMVGLQQCSVAESGNPRECNPSTVLQELAMRMDEPAKSTGVVNSRRCRNEERYDEMVKTFSDWEDRVPKGEGRRLDILRGCFAGARNQKVVEALKIVYCDYSAFRVAGDLIFSLMCKLMREKRAERR